MSAPVAPPKLPTGPISIDDVAKPNPWLHDQEREILKHAQKVGAEGVKEVIEKIRQMLGDRDAVIEHANFWMRVEGHLRDAVKYAQDFKSEVAGSWEGPAYRAFKTWEADLEGALGATGNAAQIMMKATTSMLDHITKTYNAALTLMASTAADLIEATPGVMDAVIGNFIPGGKHKVIIDYMRAATQILAAFVRNVNQFITQAIEVLNGYQKTVIDVGSASNNVMPVPPIGGGATMPTGWDPSNYR